MRIRIIIALLACGLSTILIAQPKVNSPFSRFGLGDFFDPNFVPVSQLAGISTTYFSPYHTNIANPASLSQLRATSYEVGLQARYSRFTDEDQTSPVWNGNIAYLSLAFPLFNPINEILERKVQNFHWGMAFTLMPYTDVGYDINNIETLGPIGDVERKYVGNGGTYRLAWSNGFHYKDFSAGLSLGYLFGQMSFDREINFLNDVQAYQDIFEDKINVKGFLWNLGAQYQYYLDKETVPEGRSPKKSINFGITFRGNQPFRTESSSLYLRSFDFSGEIGNIDTLLNTADARGSGMLPGGFSVGVGYRDGFKWRAGIELAINAWSNYSNEAKPEEMGDGWRFAAGVGYRPDINAFGNFFRKLDYRGGFFYEKDPRIISGEQIRQVGVTMGIAMPFFVERNISFINFGIEIGQQSIKESLKNTYAKLSLGFTLNDEEWFRKRKFN